MSKTRILVIQIASFLITAAVAAVKGQPAKPAVPEKKDEAGKVIKAAVPAQEEIKAVKGKPGKVEFKFTITQNYNLEKGAIFSGKRLKYLVVDVDTSDPLVTLYTAEAGIKPDVKDVDKVVANDLNGGATL
jgi:hypothetical protein